MRRDPRKLLYDIERACGLLEHFSRGRSLPDYEKDAMLRSACERQLEIIGEAMTRLRDEHSGTFSAMRDGPAIIGFRNRLIHGYDSVDSEIVWEVIWKRIPELRRLAAELLSNAG